MDEWVKRIEEATRSLWAMPESHDRKRLEALLENLDRCGVNYQIAWRTARTALLYEILTDMLSFGKTRLKESTTAKNKARA